MSEVLQWTGAVLVLTAFGLSQRGLWSVASYRYLIFNLVGGAGLAVAGVLSHTWGFVLLEGVWALVAGQGVVLRLAAERSAAARHRSGAEGR